MRTKRAKPVTAKNSIEMNGQLIPWSFVWRVHALCGREWDRTIDCFWKARNCTGANGVQRYIMSGLRGKAYGDRWMLHPSKEMSNGGMCGIREWWMGLYKRKGPSEEDSADVSEMIARLSESWGMPV